MPDLTAQRTLVKSPPELWSELSDVESLARHLGELGEIRITRVEPESTVAWEGELISGTVELEQSGWGTKVTFHATVPEPDPAPVPMVTEHPPEAGPEVAVAVAEEEPSGFFARWLFRRRRPVAAEPELEVAEPEPVAVEPEPIAIASEPGTNETAVDVEQVQQVLDGTLDALGQAHHRPFSRG